MAAEKVLFGTSASGSWDLAGSFATQSGSAIQPPLAQTPVDIHPALEDVRRLKEFAPSEPGALEQLLQVPWVKQLADQAQDLLRQAMSALKDLLGQLQPEYSGVLPDYMLTLLSYAVGLLVIFLALMAFYMALSYIRRVLARQQRSLNVQERVADQAVLVSAAHHRQLAAQYAKKSRYDEAVRQLYLALLCLLEERQLLKFEPTRSNREYRLALQRMAQGRALTPAFVAVAAAFEHMRYGNQAIGSGDYEQCVAQYRTLEDLLSLQASGKQSHG